MTIEEFNATGWTAGMTARYSDGRTYLIVSCDFGEQLVGLRGVMQNEPDEISWVRCENITLNAKPYNESSSPTVATGTVERKGNDGN